MNNKKNMAHYDLVLKCLCTLQNAGITGNGMYHFPDEHQFGTVLAPEDFNTDNLMEYVDLTLLSPTATRDDIEKVVYEAVIHNCAAVCVYPYDLQQVVDILQFRVINTVACTVTNFPHGKEHPSTWGKRIKTAVTNGAGEVDLVHNISLIKEKRYSEYLRLMTDAIRMAGDVPVKVILETHYLTEEEIVLSTLLCWLAGAQGVKTSTGVNPLPGGGKTHATAEHVTLMRLAFGNLDRAGRPAIIKASGGIRSKAQAVALLRAGANRIGSSGLSDD